MKNFGFGCMRLPMRDEKVDYDETIKMVDAFIGAGFTYFDTAHGYLSGLSETALRECLVKRYSRDAYTITDKLTGDFFTKEEEIRPLFQKQLEACGVTYFDYYLMHAQNAAFYEKFVACNAYDTVREFKKEGKIKHYGISFHDKAAVLDRILTEQPDIEVVQIQFNYADYDDEGVESRKCYETCVKHRKPVIVMEPVKGGTLAKLPNDAGEILNELHGGSQASYAIRFAASFEGVMMVLSGMSTLEQMQENIGFMKEFQPLTPSETQAVMRVAELFRAQKLIGCTACRYCTDGCPKHISIPDLFACMNAKTLYKDWNSHFYYTVYTQHGGKASDCIACGKCEQSCPQHLPIRALLKDVAAMYEEQ